MLLDEATFSDGAGALRRTSRSVDAGDARIRRVIRSEVDIHVPPAQVLTPGYLGVHSHGPFRPSCALVVLASWDWIYVGLALGYDKPSSSSSFDAHSLRLTTDIYLQTQAPVLASSTSRSHHHIPPIPAPSSRQPPQTYIRIAWRHSSDSHHDETANGNAVAERDRGRETERG